MELLNQKRIKRFFDKVDIPEENMFACWEWKASKNKKGYGTIGIKHKPLLAHRVSYLIWNKKFPDNFACHSCDNPCCVNPLHLWDGTNDENLKDMVLKKRSCIRLGLNNPNTKLTPEQVLQIRDKWAKNQTIDCMKELADKYKCTYLNIKYIIYRKSWKHI